MELILLENIQKLGKIGDQVKVGQTVLIVEAMKTLNQIPSTKDGIIKRVNFSS